MLDNGALTGDYGNEFFNIIDERIGVHVNQETMKGGRSVKVLKIMACKNSWLNKNYYTPLKELYKGLTNRSVAYNRYDYNAATTQSDQPFYWLLFNYYN